MFVIWFDESSNVTQAFPVTQKQNIPICYDLVGRFLGRGGLENFP